jgi:ElaB/YqjD/DUF883 family membrane-anchored ribosome-binding protein
MSTQGNIHFFANWAKERIDEMDAVLTALESKIGEINADLRNKANQTLADLRKRRDEFGDLVKKQAEAGEAAWASAKPQLEADWTRFESEVQKYVTSFGEQIKQQQATFKLQADAQLKAWREAADKFQTAAAGFAAERRSEIEANVKRMKADADTAEEKLKRLNQAGAQSWTILTAALAETRGVFDRANQAAREAFKRAA